jgi:hypothetical protein
MPRSELEPANNPVVGIQRRSIRFHAPNPPLMMILSRRRAEQIFRTIIPLQLDCGKKFQFSKEPLRVIQGTSTSRPSALNRAGDSPILLDSQERLLRGDGYGNAGGKIQFSIGGN